MEKLNQEDVSKLKNAIKLQKNDSDKEALFILWDLYKRNSENGKVIGFLGLILAKTGQRAKAIPYLEKAITISPRNELISMSLYNSYAEVEKHDIAFNVIFEYLKLYPADLYLTTLEELLEGLLKGYGTTYKDKIIFYAKKNKVPIPIELQ